MVTHEIDRRERLDTPENQKRRRVAKFMRIIAGLSREEVASVLDVTQGTLAHYENGDRTLHPDKYETLWEFYMPGFRGKPREAVEWMFATPRMRVTPWHCEWLGALTARLIDRWSSFE